MTGEVVYRCPVKCKWNKKCFVCKTQGHVKEDIVVLHKCAVTKRDIPIHLERQKVPES